MANNQIHNLQYSQLIQIVFAVEPAAWQFQSISVHSFAYYELAGRQLLERIDNLLYVVGVIAEDSA